jgi:hypothetical protein
LASNCVGEVSLHFQLGLNILGGAIVPTDKNTNHGSPTRDPRAGCGYICKLYKYNTNLITLQAVGKLLLLVLHARPANQPTITGAALWRKEVERPRAKRLRTNVVVRYLEKKVLAYIYRYELYSWF